jgi:glycosyltransferase involved in cell wall biosynthesis
MRTADHLATVLFIFNRYVYEGGENVVTAAEKDLLEHYGHRVIFCEWDNRDLAQGSFFDKLAMAWRPTWSSEAYRRISRLLRDEKPAVVHVQNFFPLASPSVFYACAAAGIPVVYTLHNYRVLCANGIFLRNGQPCTECIQCGPMHAVRYGCYRDSRLATVPVSVMQLVHNRLQTWHKKVTLYIAPTEFVKGQFVRAGYAPEQIAVKPHFVFPDPGWSDRVEPYMLFVGHLAEKKGIHVLLDAWRNIQVPLRVLGDGPLQDYAARYVRDQGLSDRVKLLGRLPVPEVLEQLRHATCMIVPSLHHEGFPRVVVEALACGVPIIASRLEPLDELIEHGRTGLLLDKTAPDQIVEAVRTLLRDPETLREMRKSARKEFEDKYTAEANYTQLVGIYGRAIEINQRNGVK